MKKNIFHLALLLTFLSCTKEQGVPGPTGTQGPQGPNGKSAAADTASIVGKVVLYNEFSYLQNDASGVVVTLISGSQQYNDTTGNYDFPGITTGTYDLTFQKPGYGTMKLFGLSNFGGGTLPTQVGTDYLMQIPVKTAPDTFTLTSNNSYMATFDLRLDTPSTQFVEIAQDMLVFISKNKAPTPTDYDIILDSYDNPDGIGGYTVYFYKSNLINLATPIVTGDTLYAVAYSFNRYIHIGASPSQAYGDYGLSSYYMDPQTGKYIYPNLSKPSNIVQFTF